MRLSRHTLNWLARLMLGLLLFAQGVVAANACVTQTSATHAYTMIGQADELAVTGSCHESQALANANACLAQNTQADQASADYVVPQFALPTLTVLRVPNTTESAIAHSCAVLAQLAPPDTGPPLPVRYCSFLN